MKLRVRLILAFLLLSVLPLGAVTISEPVYQALLDESRKQGVFAHGFTYGGHPVSCAVALKTLEIYKRIDIVGHVKRVAPIFQARLQALAEHPLVGEARGVGLIGALELMRDKRIEHRNHILAHGQDMPEVLQWQGPAAQHKER